MESPSKPMSPSEAKAAEHFRKMGAAAASTGLQIFALTLPGVTLKDFKRAYDPERARLKDLRELGRALTLPSEMNFDQTTINAYRDYVRSRVDAALDEYKGSTRTPAGGSVAEIECDAQTLQLRIWFEGLGTVENYQRLLQLFDVYLKPENDFVFKDGFRSASGFKKVLLVTPSPERATMYKERSFEARGLLPPSKALLDRAENETRSSPSGAWKTTACVVVPVFLGAALIFGIVYVMSLSAFRDWKSLVKEAFD